MSILNKRVNTLAEGLEYINGLIRAGVPFQPSRIFRDRFKARKQNRSLLILGVEKRSAIQCHKLAPGGTWGIEVAGRWGSHNQNDTAR
jgi:hypothetical protein